MTALTPTHSSGMGTPLPQGKGATHTAKAPRAGKPELREEGNPVVHGSLGPHVLAIDFDGVCAKFDGSKGAELLGAPTRGLREFLHALRAAGWKIILHSCRPEWRLEQWAFDHGIHFDGYNENPYFAGDDMEMSSKPPATAYLDDRAVRFTGDFDAAFAGVMEIADREGHP